MTTILPHRAALVAAAAVTLSFTSPAVAHDAHHHGPQEQAASQEIIQVTGAWARPTIGKLRITAAYFRINGAANSTDKLIAASTPAAAKAELHQHIMQGEIAKMRHVDAVDVAPGTPTVFKPAGYHVMIMGLKGPLNEGDSFPLTLTFEKAGDVTVTVTVSKKDPSGYEGMDHGKMDHGKMGHGGHKH